MYRFGIGYLAGTALASAAVTVLMQVAASRPDTEGAAWALLVLPLPLLLSVLWGWLQWRLQALRPVLIAAVASLVPAMAMGAGAMTLQAVSSILAGIYAGWALGSGVRPWVAMVLCAGILTPMTAWSVREFPVADQADLVRQDMRSMLQSRLPDSATPEQRQQALETELERLDDIVALAVRVYPAMIAIGLMAQGALIMGLVWAAMRLTGGVTRRLRFGSFARFRVGFAVVWLLIAGIGLVVTRSDPARDIGLNLALLAALVLSIQGVAVQVEVVGRVLSPVGRMMFWLVMGFFFAPVVIAGGIILGLADQWLDFRRLERPDVDEDEKVV